MRFFKLDVLKQNGTLLGWKFKERRAWLDIENPSCEITLFLDEPQTVARQIDVRDRLGQSQSLQVDYHDQTPRGFFDRVRKSRPKTRVDLKFRFPGSGGAFISLDRGKTALMTLTPTVICPNAILTLVQQLASGVAARKISNFIETGTLFGHTTLHSSFVFDNVYTIELSEDLFRDATRNLAHRGNIRCLHGNSSEVLKDLLPQISGTSMFFLDAHWSGDKTVDWENSMWPGYPHDTARLPAETRDATAQQLPLMAELESIAALHQGPAYIVIDDWPNIGKQNLGFAAEDFSGLQKQAVIDWMTAHARTEFHHQSDAKRYLWAIS